MTRAQLHELQTKPAQEGSDPQEVIADRINSLSEWIEQNASECREQAHLDEGTPERAYWHCGYLQALRDVQRLLGNYRGSLN